MTSYDVIGDVHGCASELLCLVIDLGYEVLEATERWYHPNGREVVFAGDFTDRGPANAEALDIIMSMVEDGIAHAVLGNHDWKLLRCLRAELDGKEFKGNIRHGLRMTLEELDARGPEYKRKVRNFLESLPTKFETDDLIVVHGAYKTAARSKDERDYNLYGVIDRDAGYDENGFPKRLVDWKSQYNGNKTIVVGHIVVSPFGQPDSEALVFSKSKTPVVDVDWGCVFGGELAAYRHPEGEFVSVKAQKVYWEKHKSRLPD